MYSNNMKKIDTDDRKQALAKAVGFIEENLESSKIGKRLSVRSAMTAEDMIVLLLEHKKPGAVLEVSYKKVFGEYTIELKCPGSEFDPFDDDLSKEDLPGMNKEDAHRAIRTVLFRSLGNKLTFSHKNGMNRARIVTGKAEQSMLKEAVIALILGIIAGVLMNIALPVSTSDKIDFYLLVPVKTMFMHALKIIIGPIIFFSIVSCISSFKNLSELGRIGAKVMGIYLLTTVFAIMTSFGFSMLLRPGRPGFLLELLGGYDISSIDTSVDTTLRTTIINIVPSNFFQPFNDSDTLQIIFLAVLTGIAVGMIGEYASALHGFFEAFNALFLTITTLIARFMPVAVFCSVTIMVDGISTESLTALAGFAATHLLSILGMLVIYALLVLVIGRVNPLTFYKKNREGMLTSLSLASSSAAMPVNMRTCTEKLGISPLVSNFSIPLGATINMDGTCVFLTVASLFLARGYGVEVSASSYLSIAVSIILLSLGCPGVPGAGLICLAVVLQGIGVPIEGIGLFMGIYPFIDMIGTMSNTTGDVAASIVAARSEGLLNKEIYDS